MNDRRDPIGVFDSGAGGISTLREMVRLLPGERFLYYGDSRNAPYGTKRKDEVVARVREVVACLTEWRIKALVIACNTATSAAAPVLRRELIIPVIGMEPALKPAQAIRKNGKILVLATPLTLREEKFERLMALYGEGAVRVPCPELVELVEADDAPGAEAYLRRMFDGFRLDEVDAVVLGCTHFVFLRDRIRRMLPERIAITDGNEGTARQLARVLAGRGLLSDADSGSVTLETSGGDENLALMKKLFDHGF